MKEVERALNGVPVLARTETVAHENLFVQGGFHHALGMPLQLIGRGHPVTEDTGAGALAFIGVIAVENVQPGGRLHHMGSMEKGGSRSFT